MACESPGSWLSKTDAARSSGPSQVMPSAVSASPILDREWYGSASMEEWINGQ